MENIFSIFRNNVDKYINEYKDTFLKFPLPKTGNLLNNYNRGDFIVVGGRRTAGKGYYILNNYVVSPLIQKVNADKQGNTEGVKVVYINTKVTPKKLIERMTLNYISNKNGGSKISLASLYDMDGVKSVNITKEKSKKLLTIASRFFDKLIKNGTLSVLTGSKSIYEIESFINSSMEEFGEINEETGDFVYDKKHSNFTAIVAIDDVSGVYDVGGNHVIRNEGASIFSKLLRDIARKYNCMVVVGVPSSDNSFRVLRASADEVKPYSSFADRTLILHNPEEINNKNPLNHSIEDFINPDTGICYIRTMYMATNHMGPSGVNVAYFLYPENGVFKELPKADDEDAAEAFSSIALN